MLFFLCFHLFDGFRLLFRYGIFDCFGLFVWLSYLLETFGLACDHLICCVELLLGFGYVWEHHLVSSEDLLNVVHNAFVVAYADLALYHHGLQMYRYPFRMLVNKVDQTLIMLFNDLLTFHEQRNVHNLCFPNFLNFWQKFLHFFILDVCIGFKIEIPWYVVNQGNFLVLFQFFFCHVTFKNRVITSLGWFELHWLRLKIFRHLNYLWQLNFKIIHLFEYLKIKLLFYLISS